MREDAHKSWKCAKQLNFKIGSAEALGEGVGALIGELEAVEIKIKALYSNAGINATYLNAPKFCPKCGGRGLTEYGEPCGCALRIEENIKEYSARGCGVQSVRRGVNELLRKQRLGRAARRSVHWLAFELSGEFMLAYKMNYAAHKHNYRFTRYNKSLY